MILVCGGAGYIGSHMTERLTQMGKEVVVVDSLSTGYPEAVRGSVVLEVGDIRDKSFLSAVFEKYMIEEVYHFAASSLVGESVDFPFKYYDNNLGGTLSLLEVMSQHGVNRIVFSSTAAVYGEPKQVPIVETQEKMPTSPYGETKLAVENLLKWADKAHGIKSVCLRYFNVAGAAADGHLGEAHDPETHLIPNVIKAAQGFKHLTVFGDDYPTPDGTCIRDYIHIDDLTYAHELAMTYLGSGGRSDVFNLGNGGGFSVKSIIEAAERVIACQIPYTVENRRGGDPAVLVADASKAKNLLGWSPSHTKIDDIIASAWKWHQNHPNGYRK